MAYKHFQSVCFINENQGLGLQCTSPEKFYTQISQPLRPCFLDIHQENDAVIYIRNIKKQMDSGTVNFPKLCKRSPPLPHCSHPHSIILSSWHTLFFSVNNIIYTLNTLAYDQIKPPANFIISFSTAALYISTKCYKSMSILSSKDEGEGCLIFNTFCTPWGHFFNYIFGVISKNANFSHICILSRGLTKIYYRIPPTPTPKKKYKTS